MKPDPEDTSPVVILTASADTEADIIRAILNDEGIEMFKVSSFGDWDESCSFHLEIAVSPSDVDAAMEILRRNNVPSDSERLFGSEDGDV